MNSQQINLFIAAPPYAFLRFPGLRGRGGNCPKKKQNPNPSPTWKIWFGFVCFGDPYGTPRLRAGRGAALACPRHAIHSRALRVPRETGIIKNKQPTFGELLVFGKGTVL